MLPRHIFNFSVNILQRRKRLRTTTHETSHLNVRNSRQTLGYRYDIIVVLAPSKGLLTRTIKTIRNRSSVHFLCKCECQVVPGKIAERQLDQSCFGRNFKSHGTLKIDRFNRTRKQTLSFEGNNETDSRQIEKKIFLSLRFFIYGRFEIDYQKSFARAILACVLPCVFRVKHNSRPIGTLLNATEWQITQLKIIQDNDIY